MKRIMTSLCLVALLVPVTAGAQETLLGRGTEHGGFGGPNLMYTQILDSDGLLMGGLGGWVIGKTIAIGGGGWGLVTEHEVEVAGTMYELQLGYGGLLLEYLHDPDRLTHWYIDALIGIGGINFNEVGTDLEENQHDDTIWVFEPSAHYCLNVTQHFRVAVGAGYRSVIGVDDVTETTYGLAAADLSGYTVGLTLRFGRY